MTGVVVVGELVSTVRKQKLQDVGHVIGPRTSALIYSREESTARETEVVQEDGGWRRHQGLDGEATGGVYSYGQR